MADTITPSAVSGGRKTKLAQRTVGLLYLAILVLVPIVVITYKTFDQGWNVFWSAISSSESLTAFRLTAEVAASAVVLNALFGVGVALLVTRFRFPGRRIFGALADLPISVSPVVAGLALILVYGPIDGWFGQGLESAGIKIIFAVPGMILATSFVSLPLILREIVPVLEEVGTDQEQAARVLGANAWQRFTRITLPIIRPALLYGIVLSLARSIGEYGAVKVVSGNVSGVGQTITAAVLVGNKYEQREQGYFQLAFILIVLTVVAITLVSFKRKEHES